MEYQPIKVDVNVNQSVKCCKCNADTKYNRRKIKETIYCKDCYDSIRIQFAPQVSEIYETISSLSKTRKLIDKKELIHNLITLSSSLKKEQDFDFTINNYHIDEFRVLCLRDYSIYQNAITQNRKTLSPEEKEKINISIIKQQKPYDRYIAFDLETTGLSREKNKIIEIGAVKVINGYAISYFKCFVKIQSKLPKSIVQVTGITDEMLASDAIPIEEALSKFSDFIQDYPLVAHNASFDMGFLKTNGDRCGFKFTNKVEDTLSLSRKYMKEVKEDGYSYKLSDLCQYIGYKPKQAHRSYDDALAAAYLYNHIKSEIKWKEMY